MHSSVILVLSIIGHDRIMVSLAKPHYTNQGIKDAQALTIRTHR